MLWNVRLWRMFQNIESLKDAPFCGASFFCALHFQSLFVNIFSVPDMYHKNCYYYLLGLFIRFLFGNRRNDPVIAHAIPPQSSKVACKCFAPRAWVWKFLDLAHILTDSPCGLPVKFGKFFCGFRRIFDFSHNPSSL